MGFAPLNPSYACWHLPQVNWVLDLRHASKMEQIEADLGFRLIVDVATAA